MKVGGNMYIIGEIVDSRVGGKILKELESRGIASEMIQPPEQDIFVIVVHQEEDTKEAFDIFRVAIGQPPVFETPKEWQKIKSLPMGQVTIIVLVISIGTFLLQQFSTDKEFILNYYFSQYKSGFPEILNGEVWRAITPAFLHFGWMHIIFNMMWWKDLGNIIEYSRGKKFLILFFVVSAIFSNFSQYFISGPAFGGMSGVVYALLGYLWMNKKFNPSTEFSLPKSDVALMVGWFFLCLFGVFSFGVANMAHAGGLTLGMIIGVIHGVRETKESVELKPFVLYISLSIAIFMATYFIEIMMRTKSLN